MTERSPVRFVLPPDFAERCRLTHRRLETGEAMSFQNLADALGLPFEFVSAACAITEILMTGRPVLVDPACEPQKH